MSRLLPLFPLQLVVFPGSAVPLHIFEERYREMVGDAEARGSEFGIVLAREEGIVDTGCTVIVEDILHRYPDGRFDVLTRGQRRFKITSVNQDKEYLRGEVEYFDDEDRRSATAEMSRRAIEALQHMRTVLSLEESTVPDVETPNLSFQLARAIDDLDFQHTIQRSRSETERLRMFTEYSKGYIERQQYSAKMKRAAPLNGSGHKPAGL